MITGATVIAENYNKKNLYLEKSVEYILPENKIMHIKVFTMSKKIVANFFLLH